MRFPLADWIDAHRECRHNLAESGMHGALPPPPRARGAVGREVLEELRVALARSIGVAPERLFLTHGATEANAWVIFHVRRGSGHSPPRCRALLPEYPSLLDVARSAGFRPGTGREPAALAVVSRPRNPEGDLWPTRRLLAWAGGARHLLVDETFREFSNEPSLARRAIPGVWVSGTFTKFYGADDLRVGYVIAPPEEVDRFGRLAGLVLDELPPASAAAALTLLRRREALRRQVRRIVDRNLAYLASVDPAAPVPVAPFYFDRTVAAAERLARRCLDASVLVCPGRFFGDPKGVRVCLTRRTFPADLDAYLRVRRSLVAAPPSRPAAGARRRRGEAARGRGGRRSGAAGGRPPPGVLRTP